MKRTCFVGVLMFFLLLLASEATAIEHLTKVDHNVDKQVICQYDLPDSEHTFDNDTTVHVNLVLENNRNYDVLVKFMTKWYRPDGTLDYSWESDDFWSVEPGYWKCWGFDFFGYPRCPGQWHVVVQVKEYPVGQGGNTGWQTVVDNDYFTITVEDPDVTELTVSKPNPNAGETITVSAKVQDAANYTGTWDDNGKGGSFSPGTVSVNDTCPQVSTHTSSYTVPNLPGQDIRIEFTATNSKGSDDKHQNISVKNKYTLTLNTNPSGAGTVSANPSGGIYDQGTNVQVSADPDEQNGWEFDTWSGDVSGTTNPVTVTMTSNKSVTANFKLQQVTLTTQVTPQEGGSILLNPEGGTYNWGTSVTVVAQNQTGYEFVRWEGDLSGSNSSETVVMNDNKSITAVFQLVQRELTIAVDPQSSGNVILNPPGGTYDHGTTVQVEAQPTTGFLFDHWEGDLSGSTSPVDIVMDQDKSITAYFVPIMHSLTVEVEPANSGTVLLDPTGGTYAYGTSVTLTPQGNPGYKFDHWDSSMDVPPIVMDSDKTVRAVFVLDTNARLRLIPASTNIQAGETFMIAIYVTDIENLYGHELDIAFDPAKLQVLSIAEGDFLNENGAVNTFWQPPNIDNNTGRVTDIVNVRLSQGMGISGSGTLALIEFLEKSNQAATYTTNISFIQTESLLSDPNAVQIPLAGYDSCSLTFQPLNFVTSSDSVTVPEGETAPFQVKLSAEPSENINVSVSHVSGDSDITVQSGGSLTFIPSNWDEYQTVTLAAAEDDDTDNGQATIMVSATNVSDKPITATELDNEKEGCDLVLLPANQTVSVDEEFDITIEARCNGQEVTGIAAYLDFDPNYLEVVPKTPDSPLTPGSTLNLVIKNAYDNTTGIVDYSAGTVTQPYPSGTFTVATVTFKATAKTPDAGTRIDFHLSSPRKTDADFGGTSVLRSTTGAEIPVIPGRVDISVNLQGGSRPVPAGWQIPLTVQFFTPRAAVLNDSPVTTKDCTTTKSGDAAVCQVTGITPGTYDITVDSEHTLMNVKRDVVIMASNSAVDLCTLLEGDANDDGGITITDFGVFAVAYEKCKGEAGYDPRADFDRSGCVNISDFGLFAVNYETFSPVSCPLTGVSVRTGDAQIGDGNVVVDLVLRPDRQTACVGDEFAVTIEAQGNGQEVTGIAAYLDFDPNALEVVSVTPGSTLDLVIKNIFDNDAGTVNYSAGTVTQPYPRGTFSVAVVTFRVKTEISDTSISFHTSSPRNTDVDFGGTSVLSSLAGTTVHLSNPLLLWTHTDGTAALWILDASGKVFRAWTHGPFAGWTLRHYHRISDGTACLLWTHTDGRAALWILNASGDVVRARTYGPYAGWTARHAHHNSDGTAHLLWTHTDGRAALWTLNASGDVIRAWNYGPFPGWTARRFHHTSDGTTRLLWTHTDGRVAVWTLNASGDVIIAWPPIGPFPGWTLRHSHHASDGTACLLWTHTDGRAALWILNANGAFVMARVYGPYAGWTARYSHHNSDGTAHVLWTHTDGKAALWTLNASGDVIKARTHGPFDDGNWTAVECHRAASALPASLLGPAGNAVIIRKAGGGTGTIIADDRECGLGCGELSVPYVEHGTVTLQVIPDARSTFVRWETADGRPIAGLHYAQPGDTVIAVFEETP